MLRKLVHWALSVVTFVASLSCAAAQDAPLLFKRAQVGGDATPRDAYFQLWSVDIDAERLRDPARAITLNLPGQSNVQVLLEHWEARRGYITVLDDNGVSHTIPDPEAAPDDFSWLWYGRGEEWTVSLTMHQGIVVGRITSVERRYGLEPRPNRVTQLGWINSDYWQTHPEEQPGLPSKIAESVVPAVPSGSAMRSAKQLLGPSKASWDDTCSAPLNPTVVSGVDVLALYTPNYLAFAGSVAQVEAAMQAALDDANTSLRNSDILSVKFALSGVEAVPAAPGFNYDSPPILGILYKLSGNTDVPTDPFCDFSAPNTAVRARRDARHADIVALARRPNNVSDNSCGVGWIQHIYDGNFGCRMEPGADWGATFPYFVFNPQCSADRLNFAHEMGHVLGMEHDPNNAESVLPPRSPGPEFPGFV